MSGEREIPPELLSGESFAGWYACAGQDLRKFAEETDETVLNDLFFRRGQWADVPFGPRVRVTRAGSYLHSLFLIGEYPVNPFVASDREMVTADVWESVRSLLDRAGRCDQFEYHVQRHTYGSAAWVRANKDSTDVAEPLVHELSALFERYGVVSDGPVGIRRRR